MLASVVSVSRHWLVVVNMQAQHHRPWQCNVCARESACPDKGQAGTFRILPALDWSFNNFSRVSFERGARACAPTTTCAHTKNSMSPVHVTATRPVIGALLLPQRISIFGAARRLGKSGLCGACLTLSLCPTAHGGRVGGGGWLRQCKGRLASV
jgi:hypothetical protein